MNEKAVRGIHELVDGAVADGATVAFRSAPVPGGTGFYYPPTVLTHVPPTAAILHTEIFGPVAPIATFTTEDEAVELANSTDYGLVSYVYTQRSGPGAAASANASRPAWSD